MLFRSGVIDCPDLPLNVSRSALQNDGFVKKISDYITKKVADKLSGMYKVDRENYEKFWDDISPFIKFGCLKDEKFRDKIKDYIIFKNLDDKYLTLPEYIEAAYGKNDASAVDGSDDEAPVDDTAKDNTNGEDVSGEDAGDVADSIEDEEKDEKNTVFYVTDLQQQSQYVNMFREQGLDAFILTHSIDQPFIQQLEQNDDKIKFQRIDAGVTDTFEEKEEGEEWENTTKTLTDVFRKALGNDKLDVQVKKLKNENVASMITLSEETRRMQDMMKMYSAGGMGMGMDMFGGGETLVLNAKNSLVKYILENGDGSNTDMFCKQLYDLAMISHRPLSAEAMTEFVARSNEIMMLLTK